MELSEVGLWCVEMVAELVWKISAIALLRAVGQADSYAMCGVRYRQVWDAKIHPIALGSFIQK